MSPNGEPSTKKCVTSKSKRSSYEICTELINAGMVVVGGDRYGTDDGDNSLPLDILLDELPVRLSEKWLFWFLVVSLIFIKGLLVSFPFWFIVVGDGLLDNGIGFEFELLVLLEFWLICFSTAGFGDAARWLDPVEHESIFGLLFDWH